MLSGGLLGKASPKAVACCATSAKEIYEGSLCHKAEILKLKQLNDMKFASAVGYGSGV